MRQRVISTAVLSLTAVLLLSLTVTAWFGGGQKQPQEDAGAPVAQDLSVTTYRGIPYQAQFLASDEEGSDLTFAVVDEPKRGTVTVDGANFTYTPKDGVTGTDRFTYTAADSDGHTSQPATVSVTIEKTKSGVTYRDMDGNPAAAAAQSLAEQGVFVGAKLGDGYYFEPDRPVSRSEFLAMALETAGRKASSVTRTGFCDDEAIPTWAKAYAAAGVADGIVQGSATPDGAAFRGDAPICWNEAAAMLNRLLDVEDVDLSVWYADRTQTPSWAAQAVGNLEAVNVLAVGSFGSDTLERTVTRADAAQMLSAAQVLLDGQPSGWFS